MRLLAGILCASTALRVCAAHTEALVYTSDSDTRQSSVQKPSISPSTARLLLAQRLGLGQFHDLGDADESALDILNKYGGKQQDIFDQEEGSIDNNKLLLIVEGVEHPEGIALWNVKKGAGILIMYPRCCWLREYPHCIHYRTAFGVGQ